jgi:hypothetical protein
MPDRGNDRVQARAAAFARFQHGKAGEQIHDQIGRAWAAGLLDGREIDAAILRDKGREYGGRYWQEFAAMAPSMGAPERTAKGSDNDTGEDKPGERFMKLDKLARSAGREASDAMHSLCVNEWWFPDDNQPWVDRLIKTAFLKAGAQVAGEIERRGDRELLKLAVDALVAMANGNKKEEISFSLMSAA